MKSAFGGKIKIIGIFTLILFLITLVNLKAEHLYSEKTVEIDLTGDMICHTSMSIIKKALKKVDGVESVEFDAGNKKVTVTYDDSMTDLSKLETAITASGFNANSKEADMTAYESLPGCCKTR